MTFTEADLKYAHDRTWERIADFAESTAKEPEMLTMTGRDALLLFARVLRKSGHVADGVPI